MRKTIALSAIMLIGVMGRLNAQNTKVDITVSGMEDGTPLTLTLRGTFTDEKPVARCVLSQGKGQFAFDSEGVRMYRVGVDGKAGGMTLVLNKGELATMSGEVKKETLSNGSELYSFDGVKVSGSDSHAFFLANKADRGSLSQAYTDNYKRHQATIEELHKLKQGSAEYQAFTESDKYKALENDERAFMQKADSVLKVPVFKFKDNEWGPLFLCNEVNYISENEKATYDQFSAQAKNSFYGKIVGHFADPTAALSGQPMPDFEFTDHSTGKTLKLMDICKQQKYVLIDFWASWCGPCRREIPNFKQQYELYKDKGFTIVSISADTNNAAWLKALEEEQLPWYNDIDGTKGICKLYKVNAYPTVYLLNSEGKVVAMNMDCRGEKLVALLKRLLP